MSVKVVYSKIKQINYDLNYDDWNPGDQIFNPYENSESFVLHTITKVEVTENENMLVFWRGPGDVEISEPAMPNLVRVRFDYE